jgi:CRISPR-associated protein Csb2
MIIRIDILYPLDKAYGEEFPLAPSTLFQAMVNYNHHRLEQTAPALETLERGKCIRIVNRKPLDTIKWRDAVPRMPEISDMHKFEFDRPQDKLLINRKMFPLPNDSPVSYYFETEPISLEQLNVLSAFQVGRGKAVCFSRTSIIERLDAISSGNGIEVWEPTTSYGRAMAVPYPGFLHNLRMYYDSNKRSSEVERFFMRYSTHARRQRHTLYKFYDDNGDVVALPSHRVNEVAGMMRCAVTKRVSPSLGQYVSGHGDEHVGYVPLPTLGPYSDGRIRRAVIIEPMDMPALPASIAELPLVNHAGTRIATAVKETETDGVFNQYLNASKKWISVTPVILSGYDDHDKKKRLRLLGKMFRHADLPKPVCVSEWGDNGEFVVNTRHGHDRYPRTMMAVEFSEEVDGVIGIGTGRNYGMGIFANLTGSAAV